MTVTIYMGDKKLEKEDYKKYICVSEYIKKLVNQVYYSKIGEYKKESNYKTKFVDNGELNFERKK